MLVADVVRLDRRLRAAPHRLLERAVRIVHLEGDVADAVAVLPEVVRRGVIGRQRRREDEARPALLERVGRQRRGCPSRGPLYANCEKPKACR